ncbi:hypothetical protein ABH920_008221 [Catenulispora sp. EB89]
MSANGERPATPSPHAGRGKPPGREWLWQATEEPRGPFADVEGPG